MKLKTVVNASQDEGGQPRHSMSGSWCLFVMLVAIFTLKVLWGYWDRDLTFGDTSSYFIHAVEWHKDGQVNIVWSPLYTAYFGSWLNVTDNAVVATFLHRLGLIVFSTGLVAWLGLLTLPRFLALLLVFWWVALPIHYDTLYEVHLFGALPILLMAVISFTINDKWRSPMILGISLVSTFLIRNEYILVVGVLIVISIANLFRKRNHVSLITIKPAEIRYGTVLCTAVLIIAYFYSASYIQGSAIRAVSATKHTLNMCQVYAFGYQQRKPDWKGSPWTECSSLMLAKFGTPMPTLREMIVSNPRAVAEHFIWNLSLTRAGLEVLLFNATSAHDNPDYAPVLVVPVLPSLFLGLTLSICITGVVLVFRKSPPRYAEIREKLIRMSPLLVAAAVMAFAVILTQRPRPSYLLGGAVLYIWVVLMMLSAFSSQLEKFNQSWVLITFVAVLVLIMPTYRSLSLPSKQRSFSAIYNELRPQSQRICQSTGALALNVGGRSMVNYLCFPNRIQDKEERGIISVASLPVDALSTPKKLVDAVEAEGASAVIIDPFMIIKYPGLKGCSELRDVFLNRGWQQLVYSVVTGERCIAAYIR